MFTVVKGIVSEFGQRSKRHVSWQNNNSMASRLPKGLSLPSIRYETITDFKVDGIQVNLSAGRSPQLANADEIAVAGVKVFSEVKALAFKNLSQNIIWGNNSKTLIIALALIIVGFLLSPQRLLQFRIIDIQTYGALLRESYRPFSMFLPWLDLMKFLRWALSFLGVFLIVASLPQFIAYLRIRNA